MRVGRGVLCDKSCRRQRTLLERESNLAFAHMTTGVVDTAQRKRAVAAIGAHCEGVVGVFEVERVAGCVLLRPPPTVINQIEA